ncbi:DUF3825 domain-containing protein [Rhodoblastus sp.]|uniref:DUF3825 domain-containing protein n=1 Tax=Rhodoblastus sp. TaxID=1962975 RepID=UPI002606622A|nr:DUF3825 domain-containing protein [Rhodoblastus sp.]
MKAYESLFKRHRAQDISTAFAHFYAIGGDYDEPFKIVARQTVDGIDAWHFRQERFKAKYPYAVPKLKNYLNYTFKRLLELESLSPGQYFHLSADDDWITFNTGLSNPHGADLLAIFQRYRQRDGEEYRIVPDWVFKGCYAPNERQYREHFSTDRPDIAWYSLDSRDFVFDTSFSLQKDVFDHLFERAKERAGLPEAPDEVVRTYLRGALEGIVPKLKRNYKVAIPVYYVEEQRMQMLLPFASASNGNDVSSFLVERDDASRSYQIKTIFDLDQAFFSARLITRPDKDWLDP